MAEQNYTIDRDLREAEAMAEALVPYVYDDELYTKLGGQMPSLTLGALLLRLRRLAELSPQMTDAQRERWRKIRERHDSVRAEWSQHYAAKLAREAESRLKNLDAYFEEFEDSPRSAANAYLPEALRRTIIQEILAVLPADAAREAGLEARVRKADGRLRRYVEPAPFLWSPVLAPVYPPETFWWLYHRPPQGEPKPEADDEA